MVSSKLIRSLWEALAEHLFYGWGDGGALPEKH